MKQGSLKTQSQALKFLNMDAGKRQNLSDSQVRGLQLERLRVGVGKWRIRTSSADGRLPDIANEVPELIPVVSDLLHSTNLSIQIRYLAK